MNPQLFEDKRRETIIEAVKAAKRSEFRATAIKVELEANLWREGDFESIEYCHDYMMERLEPLGLAIAGDDIELSHNQYTLWNPAGPMTYAEFYRDGSVDSEFTFTLMLTDPETILLLPKIIEVFKDLAVENGGHFDVSGAGMHMAFINDHDGEYPTTRTAVHTQRSVNFTRSMIPLMPALYFLGSSNEKSRGLGYRRPGVGIDSHRAAIDYRGGALEYRIFDTCYDNPEAILDNFVVMTKTLRYWRTKFVASGLEKITTSFRFGVDVGDNLDRFYMTHQHIDLLNQGLVKLKPSYYSIKELKLQRKFKNDKRRLNKLGADRARQAETEYAEYEDRFNWQLIVKKGQLTSRVAGDMRYEIAHRLTGPPPSGEQAETAVEALVQKLIDDEKRNKKTVKQYVKEKLREYEDNNRGQFNLVVEG